MTSRPPSRILLVRTDRIGDVVLTIPAIPVLRDQFPDADIRFLCRPYTAPLLRHHPDLDGTLDYDPDGRHGGLRGIGRLARELRAHRFDLAFLFHPRPELALALRLAGISERVGTGYRWYSFLLNRRVFEHRTKSRRHELDLNLSLLGTHVASLPDAGEVQFGLAVDADLCARRAEALRGVGVEGEYVVVHPGSGGSAPVLPPSGYAAATRHLIEVLGRTVLLVGTGAEVELLKTVADAAGPSPLLHIAHDWDLETYAAVIAGASLFLSNSTGPLHIARAFDVPLLGFYCPATPCHPRRWGPYGWPEAVVMPAVEECDTCRPDRCPAGGNCLEQLTWDEVRAGLDRSLPATGSGGGNPP